MTEQRHSEPGRLAARTGRRDENIGQVFFDTRQSRASTGAQSSFDPPGDLPQSQQACKEALTQHDHNLLRVVRDAHGSVIHGRHARPLMPREATGRRSPKLRR